MNFDLKLPKCFSPSITKEEPKNCPQGYFYKENPINPKTGNCVSSEPECISMVNQANEHLCSLAGMQCSTSGNE